PFRAGYRAVLFGRQHAFRGTAGRCRAPRRSRGCRDREPRIGGQPAVEEAVDPAPERRIVERMHGEMHAALLGARRLQALRRLHGPHALHLERDLGMELEAERARAPAEALYRIALAGGEKLAAVRQGHAFAMELIDLHRALEPAAAGLGRLDLDVAGLDQALRMRADPAARRAGQELGAEAQAEKGHAGLDHLRNPVELALDARQGAAIV